MSDSIHAISNLMTLTSLFLSVFDNNIQPSGCLTYLNSYCLQVNTHTSAR